jgi:hypothetical protein
MFAQRVRRHLALTLTVAGALACGDYTSATSPVSHPKLLSPGQTTSAAFSVVVSGTKARAVRWGSKHSQVDQTVTSLVGPDGATLSLPGSDFSLTIPAGALRTPAYITVISRGGAHVVYDMLPHGLKFTKPVVAVQGLSNTAVYRTNSGASVRSAYLPPDREQIGLDDSAAPSELEASTTHFSADSHVAESHLWLLNHFSRYILISGVWVDIEAVATNR